MDDMNDHNFFSGQLQQLLAQGLPTGTSRQPGASFWAFELQGRRKHISNSDPFCIWRSSPDFNSICYFVLVRRWLFSCCGNKTKYRSKIRRKRNALSRFKHYISFCVKRSQLMNHINSIREYFLCSTSFDFVNKIIVHEFPSFFFSHISFAYRRLYLRTRRKFTKTYCCVYSL